MQYRRPIGTLAYMGGLGSVYESFAWSWGAIQTYNAEYINTPDAYIHIDRARISDHAIARNSLVERMLGDWLIMLDTDHEPEPDICARLIRAADGYGLDVLTGLYLLKHPPHYPVLYEWMDGTDPEAKHPLLRQVTGWTLGKGFLEVGSAGGGCLFVRRAVFDAMREEFGGMPFDRIPPYSEDHSFFLRCRKLGIKAWAATHIESPHLRTVQVTSADMPPPPAHWPAMEVDGWEG